MRFWLLHPSFLDRKGLLGQWNESNMALGNLKKNKYHPAMDIFLDKENPELYIKRYMTDLFLESIKRNYNFNPELIKVFDNSDNKENKFTKFYELKIKLKKSKLNEDFYDLQQRLMIRDFDKFESNKKLQVFPNSIFTLTS